MIRFVKYYLWKRRAEQAIKNGLTTICYYCDDPIVPGDFIAIGVHNKLKKEVLIHAGYHFSLTDMYAFCMTGAVGSAVWNGKQVVVLGESLGAKAIRTGQIQSG